MLLYAPLHLWSTCWQDNNVRKQPNLQAQVASDSYIYSIKQRQLQCCASTPTTMVIILRHISLRRCGIKVMNSEANSSSNFEQYSEKQKWRLRARLGGSCPWVWGSLCSCSACLLWSSSPRIPSLCPTYLTTQKEKPNYASKMCWLTGDDQPFYFHIRIPQIKCCSNCIWCLST